MSDFKITDNSPDQIEFIRSYKDMPKSARFYNLITSAICYTEIENTLTRSDQFNAEFINLSEAVIFKYLSGVEIIVKDSKEDLICHRDQLRSMNHHLAENNYPNIDKLLNLIIRSPLAVNNGEYQIKWALKYFFTISIARSQICTFLGGTFWLKNASFLEDLNTCSPEIIEQAAKELSRSLEFLCDQSKSRMRTCWMAAIDSSEWAQFKPNTVHAEQVIVSNRALKFCLSEYLSEL